MSLATLTVGSGAPLVMVHGWGMNAGVWMPFLPHLENRWQVTLIELPGHGESDPVDGDIHDWAAACLDAAPRHATWLGWSLGAMVTLAAATRAPHRIDGLLLAGGTPRFVREEHWQCGMETELLTNFADGLFASPQKTMLRFLGLQVRGSDNERATLKQLREAVTQRPETQLASLEQGLRLLLETDLRPLLGELSLPTAWLYGERDTLVSAETASHLAHLLPAAETRVIPGAGHAPFLSHPGDCLEVLEAVA